MTRYAYETARDGNPVPGTVHEWSEDPGGMAQGRWVPCLDQLGACARIAAAWDYRRRLGELAGDIR